MKRKILTFVLCFVVQMHLGIAAAQQPRKIPRIGIVTGSPETNVRSSNFALFRQGLRDLGYVEGKNILFAYRYHEGNMDRLPIMVADLVELKVDIIYSTTAQFIRAAKKVTKMISIVMAITPDPVALGLVDSLAHPGGNITGVTLLGRELSGKRLELLSETIPGISRVGVLSVTGFNAIKDYEAVAPALKIQLQSLDVRPPKPDLAGAFRDAVKGRASALISVRIPLLALHQKEIIDLAVQYRLPLMTEHTEWVENGALVTYAANDAESFRRAAVFVDKILKGAKPADLPVEQPTKFDFVINLKTAEQIGLTIPPNVLVRATKVIR
jgi:putative tryptophan/tyrosine transport system substrate-binding protein